MKKSSGSIWGWISTLLGLAFLALATPALAAIDETLGPGDSVRVVVFDHPDLNSESRISARGFMRLPLLGDVKLGGLSPSGAAEYLTALLKDGNFIRDPRVNLTVLQVRSRQVAILGQVARPGRYALDETRTTLTDMLALAGGITNSGGELVTLIRQNEGKSEKMDIDIQKMVNTGDLSSNLEIENGDTLFVRKAPVFYIYGEVQRAGIYRHEDSMSIMQAISLGGGISIRGTERGIRIHRRAPDGVLQKLEAKPTDLVLADDIIYIQESLF